KQLRHRHIQGHSIEVPWVSWAGQGFNNCNGHGNIASRVVVIEMRHDPIIRVPASAGQTPAIALVVFRPKGDVPVLAQCVNYADYDVVGHCLASHPFSPQTTQERSSSWHRDAYPLLK